MLPSNIVTCLLSVCSYVGGCSTRCWLNLMRRWYTAIRGGSKREEKEMCALPNIDEVKLIKVTILVVDVLNNIAQVVVCVCVCACMLLTHTHTTCLRPFLCAKKGIYVTIE